MLYCPRCTSNAPSGHQFCGTCGTKLDWRFSGKNKLAVVAGVILAVFVWLIIFLDSFDLLKTGQRNLLTAVCFMIPSLISILILVRKRTKLVYLLAFSGYVVTVILHVVLADPYLFYRVRYPGFGDVDLRVALFSYVLSISAFLAGLFLELRKDSAVIKKNRYLQLIPLLPLLSVCFLLFISRHSIKLQVNSPGVEAGLGELAVKTTQAVFTFNATKLFSLVESAQRTPQVQQFLKDYFEFLKERYPEATGHIKFDMVVNPRLERTNLDTAFLRVQLWDANEVWEEFNITGWKEDGKWWLVNIQSLDQLTGASMGLPPTMTFTQASQIWKRRTTTIQREAIKSMGGPK